MFVERIIKEDSEEINSTFEKGVFARLNSTEGWNLTLRVSVEKKTSEKVQKVLDIDKQS